MKTHKRYLMLAMVLLLTGCLATSYDAAMKREPIILPPAPPEVKATPVTRVHLGRRNHEQPDVHRSKGPLRQ